MKESRHMLCKGEPRHLYSRRRVLLRKEPRKKLNPLTNNKREEPRKNQVINRRTKEAREEASSNTK